MQQNFFVSASTRPEPHPAPTIISRPRLRTRHTTIDHLSTMAHNHSPFLSLPTELRGIIFEFYSPRDRLFYFHHLFQQSRAANAKRKSKGEADGMYQAFAEDPRRPRDHAVAFVCKQVYCEYAVTQNILDNLFHVVNIAAPIMSASDAISLVTSQDGAGLPDLCKATKVRIRVDFLR